MSGLGRRTHYRKHLTDAVLHDFPEPDTAGGERIAMVVGTRGSNQFEIVVAPSITKDEAPCQKGKREKGVEACESLQTISAEPESVLGARNVQLAILPTKFRKLVWLKRNDFVIVRCGEDEDGSENIDSTGSIRYQIEHILYKEQVKHLKKEGFWPNEDFFSVLSSKHIGTSDTHRAVETRTETDRGGSLLGELSGEDEESDDDGIIYGAVDDFVNTNRIATLRVQDSESESESGEE